MNCNLNVYCMQSKANEPRKKSPGSNSNAWEAREKSRVKLIISSNFNGDIWQFVHKFVSCWVGQANFEPFLMEFSKFRIRPILADQKWSAILFYLREIRLNPAISSVPIQYTTSMLLNSTWLRPSHRNIYYLLAINRMLYSVVNYFFLCRSKYAHHL